MPARRSLRLPTYDYGRAGAYFVTLCTHGRWPGLSRLNRGDALLLPTGRIVRACLTALPTHFPHVALDAWVIMPDHVHVVVWIRPECDGRGAACCAPTRRQPAPGAHPHVPPGSLGAVVRAFKSAATRAVNLAAGTPGAPLWQRNYYERVVRSPRELDAIRRYIEENPARAWHAGVHDTGASSSHPYLNG